MTILLAKLVFLLIGLYTVREYDPQTITAFLLAVAISALLQYLKSIESTAIGVGLFGLICFFLPIGIYFFPTLVIDLSLFISHRKYYLILLIPIFIAWQEGYLIWFILTMALAFISGYLIKQNKTLATAYTTLQDSHTEQSTVLRHKNNELLETQNKMVSLATLQERNRIARDIHDNIGHILVRGILLIGVLKTTNKAQELTESITTIESILKEAMDSIRKAVHDWKDEAIDLHETIEKLSSSTMLDVDLQYDMSNQTPADVKLCLLIIIKEALTNTTKHSDATAIRLTLQEHPSLYQLLIKDNGSDKESNKINHGMGLSNIEERVLAMGGACTFESRNGFRIFISIPKE
ncbi:MAG: histidine kinase [Defluviitaleaceae bacterium]|nr:histidine kinase [Defluviitaleaceae bacterium]